MGRAGGAKDGSVRIWKVTKEGSRNVYNAFNNNIMALLPFDLDLVCGHAYIQYVMIESTVAFWSAPTSRDRTVMETMNRTEGVRAVLVRQCQRFPSRLKRR